MNKATGIKDQTGKEICSGDIVLNKEKGESFVGRVVRFSEDLPLATIDGWYIVDPDDNEAWVLLEREYDPNRTTYEIIKKAQENRKSRING